MDVPKLPYYDIKGCVFKLFWGKRYVIVKCKFFPRAKTIIETSISYHFKTGMKDKLYEKFFDYIRAHPFYEFKVEILFESENHYQLLVREQQELDRCHKDEDCMNVNSMAYVPKGIQGKRKAWINRGEYLNFMQWYNKTRQSP